MSEMLEKVAREMREKYNADFLSGGDLVPFEESKARDAWMACAIAAVRALREPSDEMMAEAYRQITIYIEADNRDLYDAWRSAIDSILSTQPQEER